MANELTPPKLTLWDIESAWVELMQARTEAEGLSVDEREQAVAAVDEAIAQYTRSELQKADSIIGFCRHLKMLETSAKEQAAYQSKRAATAGALLSRIKGIAQSAMEAAGKKRIDGRTGYLLVKNNGGLAPLKIQEDVLPDEYRDITITISAGMFEVLRGIHPELVSAKATSSVPANDRIRKALAEGTGVPGAWLEERGSHIEVK